MTLDGPQIAGATARSDAGRAAMEDWAAVRASDAIQYAPLPPPEPPQTPGWMQWLERMLDAVFGPIGKALGAGAGPVKWILIALGATLLPGLEQAAAKASKETDHRAKSNLPGLAILSWGVPYLFFFCRAARRMSWDCSHSRDPWGKSRSARPAW